MTNGPLLVSKRARKRAGAVSVNCDGSVNLLDWAAVCARPSTPNAATTRSVPSRAVICLRTASELPRFSVHPHALPFLDEQRHPDLEACVGARDLGDRSACRVTARPGLRLLDRHLDQRRQLQTYRVPVELVDLHNE